MADYSGGLLNNVGMNGGGVNPNYKVDYSSVSPNTNILGGLTGLIGGLIGNSIGGDTGKIVSLITGSLGNSFTNTGSFKGGLLNFTKGSNLVNLGSSIGTSLLDGHTAHLRIGGKYGNLAAGVDTIGGMFKGNPYATVGMAAINKLTGGTDGMTILDSLLGSSSVAGALFAANPWVGVGYMALSGLNSAFGSTVDKNANNDFYSREKLDSLWGSYSKSQSDHLDALKYGGKKYGALSHGSYKKALNKVRADNQRTDTLIDIYNNNELANIRGSDMIDINNMNYALDVYGGYNQYGTRIGRQGMKLPTLLDISKVKSILSRKSGGTLLPPKPELFSILAEDIEDEVQEFKEGGTIIPEGALHARKNNMEGAGKDFTHKGIPVIDNQGELQAEIECNEIIFSLEVTKKLELLMNDGSDKAAIEAGKLLVKEIFENTDDRTGLIASITGEDIIPDEEDLSKLEEGGTIEIAKEGTKVSDNEEDTISLEDFINEKIKSRTEAAILKATTRKTPYMFRNKSWKNCIATIADNYGVPVIMRNSDLATDPNKYGFEEIFFGDNTDTLPDGVILLDYNKENDSTVPGHSIMLVGRTETGAPIYSYSSGDNTPESMHRSTTNYKFRRWDDKVKPRAYRYIGTPAERLSWTDEYNALYPKKQ